MEGMIFDLVLTVEGRFIAHNHHQLLENVKEEVLLGLIFSL